MSNEAQLLAGMAAIAALGGIEDIPQVKSTEKHTPIKGHICGHDMGKDPKKCQKRNSLCMCGSGKKSKRCCVVLVTPSTTEQKNLSGESGECDGNTVNEESLT